MIVIIDYNTGNLRSVQNMLKRIGHSSVISNKIEKINKASKLILPGVGSFDYGINQLEELGILEILTKKAIQDKTPFLGICLGAQLLTKGSEEGERNGLGWFNAKVVNFDKSKLGDSNKIPHMSWTDIEYNKNSKLFDNFNEQPRFYFVHSYHILAVEPNEIAASVSYGYEFTAVLEKDNILAVQFHPEKSHRFGMQLLKNFAENY